MKNPSQYGDQYVTVQIQVPKNLSAEAKQKLREFEKLASQSSNGHAAQGMHRNGNFYFFRNYRFCMFIFNWYAIMTVRKFVDSRKEMRMENQKEKSTKKRRMLKFIGKHLTKNVVIVLAVVLVIALGAIGLRSVITSESKTTKIGFENIGELATQSAYCTEVNVTDDWRKLFGIKIPFTQSKYIYSYDFVIKAGYDFKDIKWSEKGDKIEVTLPEVKVLSNEIDLDSFKVYHEEESIFSPITLDESNEALENLKKTAQDDAIANGLFENARSNAETILTGFFGNVYDLDKYEIVFQDK